MQNVFVAAKALIENEGKYLVLIQEINGKKFLDLPGGRLDFGELPKQTLLREVKEETTLDVNVDSLIGVWDFFRESDGAQVICITYTCSLLSVEVDISKNPVQEDIASFLWLSKEEILSRSDIPSKGFRELFESLI